MGGWMGISSWQIILRVYPSVLLHYTVQCIDEAICISSNFLYFYTIPCNA